MEFQLKDKEVKNNQLIEDNKYLKEDNKRLQTIAEGM